MNTLGYFVSQAGHKDTALGFPGHERVCQRLSPAQAAAEGEWLDCVSSLPLVFIIPQGSLVTMATQFTGCQVQSNMFQSKKFCWHHPSLLEGTEDPCLCTAVGTSLKREFLLSQCLHMGKRRAGHDFQMTSVTSVTALNSTCYIYKTGSWPWTEGQMN